MGNLEQAILDNIQDDMCSLVLSVVEAEVLLNLVEYMKESDVLPMEYERIANQLQSKLTQSLEISCATYYVNVYEHVQVYGGPEEGGWWYWTKECLYVDAFVDIDNALDVIPELADEWFEDVVVLFYTDLLNRWIRSADNLADRYLQVMEDWKGRTEYYSIEIEYQPAATEDLKERCYE